MTPHRRQGDRITFGDILTGLIGLGFIVAAGWLLKVEVVAAERPQGWHVALYFGMGIFGAALIRPDPVFDRLKRMADIGKRFVPGYRPSREVREDDIK